MYPHSPRVCTLMVTVKDYLCPWLKPGYLVKLRKVHTDTPLKPIKDPLDGELTAPHSSMLLTSLLKL